MFLNKDQNKFNLADLPPSQGQIYNPKIRTTIEAGMTAPNTAAQKADEAAVADPMTSVGTSIIDDKHLINTAPLHDAVSQRNSNAIRELLARNCDIE